MCEQQKFSVSWALTTACNYKCSYCYRYTQDKTVSLKIAKKIIDRLYTWGCRKISLAGGEPLLWHSKEKVAELVNYIKHKGMITEIITNGFFLKKSDLDYLKDFLDILTIDIDTLDIPEQVKLGRPESHIENAIILHNHAKSLGIKIKTNTVATSLNCENVKKMCGFIKQMEYYRWKIYQFMPVKEFTEVNSNLIVNDSEFEKLRDYIEEEMKSSKIQLVLENNKQMASSYINISPSGLIHTNQINNNDEILKKEIGNVLDLELQDILNYQHFDRKKFFYYHSIIA